jgi:adenylate cyclase
MSGFQSKNSTTRRLSTILFADITGYTAMMNSDEKNAVQLINQFRDILEKTVPENKGDIIQYFGDGCLLSFESATDGVQCATALHKMFIDQKIPVRVGLHLGDVLFKNNNAFGDGVNIASRIESMGVPGAVLVSKSIRDQIKNKTEFQVTSLGTFEFKNVEEAIEIYALSNPQFVVPKRADIHGKLKPNEQKTAKWRVLTLLVALAVISAIMLWYAVRDNAQPTTLEYKPNKSASIAVLAFDDMSPDKDQEYFCDGVSEEILNTLAQLEELKVAGRTSSFYFKGKDVSIAEIGDALHVDYVLEGSVRKQGNSIRITAQLIKVDNGFHVWSKTYDRDFTDLFAIQDEMAQTIGEALLERLAPEQLVKLTTNSTRNSEAFNLYLKGKHIHRTRYFEYMKDEDFKISENLFQEAIKLDPDFALAHAGLADLYDTRTNLAIDDTTTMYLYDSLKMKESEIAFRLAPNQSYVQLVRGFALQNRFLVMPDYDGAFQCFLKAYHLNPNATDGLEGLAAFYAEKDLNEDAIKFYDKAIALNIADPYFYVNKGGFLLKNGQRQDAIEICKTALEFNPGNLGALKVSAWSYFYSRDTAMALSIYERIETIDSDYIENSQVEKIRIALLKGDTELATSLNPNSGDLHFFTGNELEIERRTLEMFQRWKEQKNYSQQSKYNMLVQYPYLQNKAWFQQMLKEEKEKHDLFYSKYPRAEEILK